MTPPRLLNIVDDALAKWANTTNVKCGEPGGTRDLTFIKSSCWSACGAIRGRRLQERLRGGGVLLAREDVAMDHLTKREQPDRSKINMHEAWEVKYWSHALGVSREELQHAVDKVGNSAAAVRKELAV